MQGVVGESAGNVCKDGTGREAAGVQVKSDMHALSEEGGACYRDAYARKQAKKIMQSLCRCECSSMLQTGRGRAGRVLACAAFARWGPAC